MDWMELLSQIFELCIIPLLGVLASFAAKWLNAKGLEISTRIKNETLAKYTTMLFETITACVISTNQTYVEELKRAGKFDSTAQKEAFERTYNAVLNALSEEAKKYLTELYGDLNTFIAIQIEKTVNVSK